MKAETTRIILIIAVAVALILLWKKSGRSTSYASSANTTGNNVDLNYILSHVSFDAQERAAIRNVAKSVQMDKDWRELVQSKANEKGMSFDKMVAIDAIWLLLDQQKIDNNRYNTLYDKIVSL